MAGIIHTVRVVDMGGDPPQVTLQYADSVDDLTEEARRAVVSWSDGLGGPIRVRVERVEVAEWRERRRTELLSALVQACQDGHMGAVRSIATQIDRLPKTSPSEAPDA